MALKKNLKAEAGFSMSSMTDIVFLLLLFYVMATTMSSPNDIKLNLPQSDAKNATKTVLARVSIDNEGKYYVASGRGKSVEVPVEQLESYILNMVKQDSSTIALHADQDIAYKEVIRVMDIANRNHLKLVVATKTVSK